MGRYDRALEDRRPREIYESIGTLESAYGKLDDVLDSAVRTVIAGNFLREAVRDSNNILGSDVKETFQTGDARDRPPLRTSRQSKIEL